MGKPFDLAIMTPSSAFGTSATIPLGSAASVNGVTYLSFSAAGAVGGTAISYSLLDPVNGGSECGTATYTSSNTTLTGRTPTFSTTSSGINASSGTLIQSAIRAEDAAIVNISNNFTANQGFGVAAPIAPIQIGANSSIADTDAQVLVARNVDSLSSFSSQNGHCFADSSLITRSGASSTFGYNSFDARVTHSCTTAYNHYAGFQTLPTFSGSGTGQNYYGVLSGGFITAGAISSAHHFYASAMGGGVPATVEYGYYCEALTGTTNFAFFAAGSTPSLFGGTLTSCAAVASNQQMSAGPHLAVNGQTTIVVGNSSFQPLTPVTAGVGQYLLSIAGTVTTGNPGLFLLADLLAPVIVSQALPTSSTWQASSSPLKYGIAYSSAAGRFNIYNNIGASETFKGVLIRYN